ncbi:MAG: copper resistance protein CopC [Acetobacteraceae bacterium]
MIARALVTVALLLATPSAWPHAFLARAAPPVGSQSATSPAQLTLRFTEPVEPLFCTVELQDPAGAAVTLPAPRPEDGAQALVVPLPKLSPGTYTVIWHVTSIDTHKTEGRYQFTVGP